LPFIEGDQISARFQGVAAAIKGGKQQIIHTIGDGEFTLRLGGVG